MYLKCIFVADCLTFCSLFVLYTYYNTLCMCNVFQFTSVMNIKGDNYRKYLFVYIQQLIALHLIISACKSANGHVLICCVYTFEISE